jgi:predicted metal-dependent phosphoesterase TrpH
MVTALCDLHTHTYYSDGLPSPQALVRKAASLGLNTLAITDHDNTRGSREAMPLAKELGIRLIPGIEFGTRWDGYGWPEWGSVVDLLGYFVDWQVPEFKALEEAMLAEYLVQVGQMCEEVSRIGYPVTMEEATAAHPHYPSVFSILSALKGNGLVADGEDQPVLDRIVGCWQRVSEYKFPIDRVIATIHAAGGVAVLAHPAVVFRPSGSWITSGDLARLVEMGLDGIEIYHYRRPDEATRAYFLSLARTFDLAISGGSDEHGRPSGFTRLGQQPVTEAMVAALQARCPAR